MVVIVITSFSFALTFLMMVSKPIATGPSQRRGPDDSRPVLIQTDVDFPKLLFSFSSVFSFFREGVRDNESRGTLAQREDSL